MFTTEEVLQIAKEAEEATKAQKGQKTTRIALVSVQPYEIKENILGYVYIDSEFDPETVAKERERTKFWPRLPRSYVTIWFPYYYEGNHYAMLIV